jgi:hypothetical protein
MERKDVVKPFQGGFQFSVFSFRFFRSVSSTILGLFADGDWSRG